MRFNRPQIVAVLIAAALNPFLISPFDGVFSACLAQDKVAQPAQSDAFLRSEAVSAMRAGNSMAAVEIARRLTSSDSPSAASMLLAADIHLRCGDPAEAVLWFDRYLKMRPEDLPQLWQRGIALYFDGKFKQGAAQFEVHRRVNPNDVENAAWHFLCVAKSESIETAKRLVLPAPNDPRIPMEEVLGMLSSGDREAVQSRMESVPSKTDARARADFYGNFYLGLYADADGDSSEALRLLQLSAKDAPHHYMGDVARAYVKYLKPQESKKPQSAPAQRSQSSPK